MEVTASLIMDAHPIRSGLGEYFDIFVGVVDHHVAVEGQAGDSSQRLDDRRPEGEVGHKVAVHHVNMDNGSSAPFSGLDFFAQSGEVGRKNGWKQLDQDATSLSSVLAIRALHTQRHAALGL